MNKAFVREEDTINDRCPRCGSAGRTVGGQTLHHFLRPEARGRIAEPALFCAQPGCDIVYFDQFGRSVSTADVVRPVYPKDPAAPICGCFGFGREEIEEDIAEGAVTRCRELLAKSKSPEARCATMSADGKSCAAEVQRYFFRMRERSQEPRP